MKKILFLLTSLLAASSALCFAGCNDKGNTDTNNENGNALTRINSVEDGENGDTCPDCEKHGMPKVRFEFKDGRPACKGDKDGIEPPSKGHHKKHPLPPKPHKPAPPEEGGQDKNEN